MGIPLQTELFNPNGPLEMSLISHTDTHTPANSQRVFFGRHRHVASAYQICSLKKHNTDIRPLPGLKNFLQRSTCIFPEKALESESELHIKD